MVDSIDRDEETALTRVNATIFVDRDSQKGILIGERGRMMKDIGSSSRRNLEQMLGSRVHLSLWVKVRQGWRDDAAVLRLLGLPPG